MPSFQGQSLTLQENEFDAARRLVRHQNAPAIVASVGLLPLDPAQSESRLDPLREHHSAQESNNDPLRGSQI